MILIFYLDVVENFRGHGIPVDVRVLCQHNLHDCLRKHHVGALLGLQHPVDDEERLREERDDDDVHDSDHHGHRLLLLGLALGEGQGQGQGLEDHHKGGYVWGVGGLCVGGMRNGRQKG